MPIFSKQLRRLSSGFQSKLPSRKSAAVEPGPGPAIEPTQPVVHVVPAGPHRLHIRFQDEFEHDDDDHPPPAYSFVEQLDDEAATRRSIDEDDYSATPPLTPDSSFSRAVSIDARVSDDPPCPPAAAATVKDDNDNIPQDAALTPRRRPFSPTLLSRLPAEVWMQIATHLPPATAAHLALTTRELTARIGPPIFAALNAPAHRPAKLAFLSTLTPHLPHHLLCHACATYHARAPPSHEKLRSPGSTRPALRCPLPARHPTIRLTADHALPFALAQLAGLRAQHGAPHGIPASALSRTWTTSPPPTAVGAAEWTHRASATTSQGRVLFRVVSTTHAQASLPLSAARLVLAHRTDYTASYSTCAHEARGAALFAASRCALSHVPAGPARSPPSQCASCRPLWRCMLCRTEYLVELVVEEQSRGARRRLSNDGGPAGPQFRHALRITRWTDLGRCASPDSDAWAACARPGTYADADSTPVAAAGAPRDTVRRRFEHATGARESSVPAVPLRRACHWRSGARGPTAEEELVARASA